MEGKTVNPKPDAEEIGAPASSRRIPSSPPVTCLFRSSAYSIPLFFDSDLVKYLQSLMELQIDYRILFELIHFYVRFWRLETQLRL